MTNKVKPKKGKGQLKAIDGGKSKRGKKGASAERIAAVKDHLEKEGHPATLKARELAKRAEAGDQTALDAMTKIVVTFESWRKAIGKRLDEGKAIKTLVGAAESRFAAAVEASPPADATEQWLANDWPLEKLKSVESVWQELKEAEAEAEERMAKANDDVRKAAKALDRAMVDGAQLTIPGT